MDRFIPIGLKEANKFVLQHHRHNKPTVGHKFSIGLIDDEGELVGVGIAGRPVARMLDNGNTLEIYRVCVLDGHKNANSQLYARIIRIARLMGYNSIITYTLEREAQSSIKAVGGRIVSKQVGLRQWDCMSRPREHQDVFEERKYRWELNRDEEIRGGDV